MKLDSEIAQGGAAVVVRRGKEKHNPAWMVLVRMERSLIHVPWRVKVWRDDFLFADNFHSDKKSQKSQK